ncbi:MAG: prepilin-type N-terminal cleavage/methylation domain-containing protein [Bdellovibrionales bacterium]
MERFTNHYNSIKRNQGGFTLLELSISLLIIGVLLGGILLGANLIDNARVVGSVKDMQDIQLAVRAFEDRYNARPGDFRRAVGSIPGCDATTNCANGDGNGFIASTGADDHNWDSKIVGTPFEAEATQAWKHLALADMLSGIEPAAGTANPDWKETHPEGQFGGGYEIYYDRVLGPERGGHVIRYTQNGLDAANPTTGGLDPAKASQIDRKLDDGNANAGYITADYGQVNNNCKTTVGNNGDYDEDQRSSTCVLFFKVTR